ncbi:MAG: long-chain-fatty-acid--CoA ligase [Hyphomonas sp.]|uniref:long-chain-fatty-acid--CoA ligase n=1 Tax=Hyphomonas sp. TaxID=87 RepID=UPI0017EF2086|nr:long-chain-fatty-acid--CoA ligase [Hyphomonas sp.]MBA3070257.1 long-chain-fatty-acid--CoA ligase [Hyphomonas sp.]MBU3919404.1 long-chain-fatty-acid--CoA ligase [Alphaproteobacteria bacterium]MBU4062742.1 long-chain-fatty-acid--CoA ligase [Alphaproteobacteria bacterium]MBU4163661.1 long-chain-fatty-acid--CoA ligase [Alphaproteobacteria bacterium]
MIDVEAMPYLAQIPGVQAARRPGEVALWFEGRATSFADLEKHANQVANGLLGLGVKPGERIGYLAKNTDVYYEMLFGAAKVRAVMNGVNTRLAAPEVKFILSDAKAAVLFVGKEFYAMIDTIKAELPDLKRIITIDGDREDWDFYPSWRNSKSAADPGIKAEGADDVIQLYTSGTTGLPKGVQLTNENYRAFFAQAKLLEWSSYGAGEAVMNAMPLFHVAGVNVGILAAAQGAKTVILREIDPQVILKLIPEHKIAHAFWVPAVILMLTQQANIRDVDFSSLKQVFYGASPISEALLRTAVELTGARFTQLYGLTETVGAGTFLPPEAHDPAWGKLRSCGVPWPGAVVRVVDGEGKPVPTGDVGEIVIKAGFVMKGYWNRADATKEAVRDGFFYTGDAGYFDEDGFLFIHDRVKDMIVSGGENVYPAEVENAIFGAPGVADVAVIGVPDEKWGEAVKAIVVRKPGEAPTPESIIAWAKERIAAYKAPKTVDFIDALPRNPSGKILRKDLRESYWKGMTRRVG